MADEVQGNTEEMEGAEVENNVSRRETTGEIEMGAAVCIDSSNHTHLHQVSRIDHSCAGDGCGSKCRFSTFADAAGG